MRTLFAVLRRASASSVAGAVGVVLAVCVLLDVVMDSRLIRHLVLYAAVALIVVALLHPLWSGIAGRQRAGASRVAAADPSLLFSELSRARRYQRQLSVVAVGLRGDRGPRASSRRSARSVRSELALREHDRWWADGSRVFILLPETDREGAARLVGRLIDHEVSWLEPASAAVATFPQDAVTTRGLLAALEPDRPLHGTASTPPADSDSAADHQADSHVPDTDVTATPVAGTGVASTQLSATDGGR